MGLIVFCFIDILCLKISSSLVFVIKKILIECFHSRGQHLCKFIGTKESVCIRKEFNSQRIGLRHQHGRRFIVLDTNMATVTSCENTLKGSRVPGSFIKHYIKNKR